MFIFGSFNCGEYTVNDFVSAAAEAEATLFGGQRLFSHWLSRGFESRATLYPLYLIDDDLFQVFKHFFAVSDSIKRVLDLNEFETRMDVFCCVIPRRVVALYDHDVIYKYSIDDIDEWLSKNRFHVLYRKTTLNIDDDGRAMDIDQQFQEQCARMATSNPSSKLLVFLIDRRQFEIITVIFECWDIDDVFDLTTNHFIGMHFSLCHRTTPVNGKPVVKSWLHYGNSQRLRFWPEQMTWFIPRLFLKTRSRGYEFVSRLYGNDYKHGFCVDLNDPIFARYYKMITGWEHHTVNYRRCTRDRKNTGYYGLRDYIQRRALESKIKRESVGILRTFLDGNGYCSDTIHEDLGDEEWRQNSNISRHFGDEIVKIVDFICDYKNENLGICTRNNKQEIWICPIAREMRDILQTFAKHDLVISDGNLKEFDYSAVISGLDHLAEVHDMFGPQNRRRIQHYFMSRIPCTLAGDCGALVHHCSRRREMEDDELSEDVELEMDKDVLLSVTRSALSSTHCYLLHSDETLYRLSGENRKFELLPFSTPVQEDNGEAANEEKKGDDDIEAPLMIDFGVHILRWLPFGVQPNFESFAEEMIHNPHSTLSPELWDEYRLQCVALLDGNLWTMYALDELMCLKLYSDCTKLQNRFRKAHWKSVPLEDKKRFYQWGLLMYKTFLFHGQPIPKQGNGPSPLYHGLNQLFRVQNTAPTYLGPFSTTISTNVADIFADGQGLVFKVWYFETNIYRFYVHNLSD